MTQLGLVLLASDDPVTIQQLSHALEELSISPDVCREVPAAVGLFDVIVDLKQRLLGRVTPTPLCRVRQTGETFSNSGRCIQPRQLLRRCWGPGYSIIQCARPTSQIASRATVRWSTPKRWSHTLSAHNKSL
jgi:hypothetical protein